MTRHSGEPNKLRDINTVGCSTRNISIQVREIYNLKIKIIALIIIFFEISPSKIDKCKSKNGASVSDEFALFK